MRHFLAVVGGAWLLAAMATAQTSQRDITLLIAGDVTLGGHYQEYIDDQINKKHASESIFSWGFDKVGKVTRAADLFLVNLECPFTERGELLYKNFNFRARPELVSALTAGGVDVVTLANNHVMDYGSDGLADTLETLDNEGIRHFGAGQTLSEARQPAIVEVNGVRIAFLGYLFLGEQHLEPFEIFATDYQPGAAGEFGDVLALQTMVEEDIRAARDQADHVIPFFHWGREGHSDPEPYQVTLAHAAIDAGASAVLGSHPHVLQGIEVYKGAPIAYSLGNFVFGGNWNPGEKRTALLKLQLNKTQITQTTVIPAMSDRFPTAPFQPYIAQGSHASMLRAYIAKLSSGFTETLVSLGRRARH